jgi:hypothetical protein
MTVKIRGLRPASALKYVAVSFLTFYLILALIFGLLAMAGCNTMRWNRGAVHGIAAMPLSLMICLVIWVFSTVFTWIALSVGFTVFQSFCPTTLEAETDVLPTPDDHLGPSTPGWSNRPSCKYERPSHPGRNKPNLHRSAVGGAPEGVERNGKRTNATEGGKWLECMTDKGFPKMCTALNTTVEKQVTLSRPPEMIRS